MSLLIINTLGKNCDTVKSVVGYFNEKMPEFRVFHTEDMKLQPCTGCNACWLKTPGICAIRDDYEQILKAYLEYDAVVFISGTQFGFIDYKTKNLIDRILPLATMYVSVVDGQMRHDSRYDNQYRFGLLYTGTGDREYLNYWMERFCLNFHGVSMGAFPIQECEEVLRCI